MLLFKYYTAESDKMNDTSINPQIVLFQSKLLNKENLTFAFFLF